MSDFLRLKLGEEEVISFLRNWNFSNLCAVPCNWQLIPISACGYRRRGSGTDPLKAPTAQTSIQHKIQFQFLFPFEFPGKCRQSYNRPDCTSRQRTRSGRVIDRFVLFYMRIDGINKLIHRRRGYEKHMGPIQYHNNLPT